MRHARHAVRRRLVEWRALGDWLMGTRAPMTGLVVAAVIAPGAAGPAGAAESKPLPIAFSSTLPSWPPPDDLDAWSLFSVSAAGGKPVLLDRAGTDGYVVSSRSPDEKVIALVRGDAASVRLVDADGGNERVLFTADGTAREALDLESSTLVWAPDGRSIAIGLYSTRYCGPGSTKCAVVYVAIVGLDGRRLGTIYSARNPSWSPDGRLLLVERNDIFGLDPGATTIDVVRPSGETVRTVGQPTSSTRGRDACFATPEWSPDARFVSFDEWSCNGEPLDRFHVVRATDGSSVRTGRGWVLGWDPRAGLFAYGDTRRFFVARARDGAVIHSATGWFAAWAPESQAFVYVGPRPASSLYVGLPGQTPRQVAATTTRCVTLSADGRWVYYSARETGHPLYAVRLDGRQRRPLAPRTSGECVQASPDGRLLAFWPTARRLAVVDARAGTRRVVVRFPARSRSFLLGWADAGSRLLYMNRVEPLPRPALWLLSGDGAAARRITGDAFGASSPAWSPDGASVVFTRTPREGEEPGGFLSVVRMDGRAMRTIVTLRGQQVSSPAWSPDGSTITYSCGDTYSICAVGADGRRPRVLVTPRLDPTVGQIYFFSPVWSPDSQWIVYAKNEPGRGASVRAVRPDGTGDRLLFATNIEGTVFASMAISPDGTRLALAGQACPPPGPCRSGLFVADTSGERLRFVAGTDDAETPTWSPDGRTIAFAVRVGLERKLRELYAVDVEEGTPRRLTGFRADAADPNWLRTGP